MQHEPRRQAEAGRPLLAAPAGLMVTLAEGEQTVTDDKGRVLVIREVSALEEMDLLEAAGESASSNRRWMVNATLYACVRAIDGVPRPFPTTRKMIRAHIEVVGGAGISAVVKLLSPVLPDDDAPDAPMADDRGVVAGN